MDASHSIPPQPPTSSTTASGFYCPRCARPIDDPLICGDCSAIICRTCGTPLESADELAFG
ncbi:MAG: hypothetical protein ACR2JE_13020 [Acidobacteriaceae bacterium]